MPFTEPVVVFSPAQLAENPPEPGAFVVVARFVRRNEEVADAAAALRDADHPFTLSWVDRGGTEYGLSAEDRQKAEEHLARALAIALTKGKAARVHVYGDQISRHNLLTDETVVDG